MTDLLSKINRYGSLSIPLWFWLVIGFQARHWLLFLGTGASMRRSPETARILAGEGLPYLQLALEIPVLLLAYAALNRDPGAGALVRRLWRHGREIITLSGALHLGWIAWYFAGVVRWSPMPDNLFLLGAVADAGIIALVWRSELLKELFADFPKPKEEQPKQ